MTCSAIYNVWDATELLEGSIRQIRNQVDTIIAVVQKISNYGEEDDAGEIECERLKKIGLIDIVVYYEPDLTLPQVGNNNEIIKRQLGIDVAKHKGCTHYLLIDCDEYYDTKQFFIAKKIIEKYEYDASSCHILTYFKKPTYQITPIETYQVPFIHKLYDDTRIDWMNIYPANVDPTRKPSRIENWKYFRNSELVMHHYSHTRKDYAKKVRNSSARTNWSNRIDEIVKFHTDFEIGKEMSFYPTHKIKEVPNYFNIKL